MSDFNEGERGSGAVESKEGEMNTETIALTDGERRVLVALFRSAAGNDHDFGFIEDARPAVGSPAQLAGYVSQLSQKGLIWVGRTENAGTGPCTQFTWAASVEAIRAAIAKAHGCED